MTVSELIERDIDKTAGSHYNLKGSLAALFLVFSKENFLAIARDTEHCARIHNDYKFYKGCTTSKELLHFPDSEDILTSGRQIELLINADTDASLIISLSSAKKPLRSGEQLCADTFTLKTGVQTGRESLVEYLSKFGYRQVSMVIEAGEFSVRNYIIDIFPATVTDPLRIEFFGDEVESIRVFSVDTQKTIERLNEAILYPLKQESGDRLISDIFEFGRIICLDIPQSEREKPENLFLDGADNFYSAPFASPDGSDGGSIPMSGLGLLHSERKSIYDLPDALKELSIEHIIVIICPATAQAHRLREIFSEKGMDVPVINPSEIWKNMERIVISTGSLTEGIFIPGLMILTDFEIFGETYRPRSMELSRTQNLLRSMDELNIGDYVVHSVHGIGVFEGLQKESAEGFESDMLIVRYSDDARLFVPVHGINNIRKYTAEEGVLPNLDRLGGVTWQRVKSRVKAKIRDIADKLIKLYAQRELAEGVVFSPDTELHKEFDDFFPYEPTPDQLTAIREIKDDMESARPMDRLLCGDVGYGKTEVAMRAAFKAVYDGRQVIVLAPTTLLCEQHYVTFKERFSAFDMRIDYISRFRSRVEINGILKKLERGEVDIVIGTHGLLRKDLKVLNLGLLVIDEEHKFGVAQKTMIKELKKGVDCLSLSATPIPRTLQMVLSGIWNMSVIETPPEDRLSIRTLISVFNKDLIREAIGRELERNGQVFFIHNRIADIDNVAAMVKSLMPNAKIAIAHGSMPERELERIILDFMKGWIEILVSTSIIGAGLDIPRANTIIINRADMIGLADLYQMRGRVGRSSYRAYAYFLIPVEDAMTDKAKKRLAAIQELSYLGAGLRLAMKDMEIRGAGNLIGAEQSGHIHAVGFDTYMEMLEEEIANLRGCPIEKEREAAIDLRIEALIPEDYISDVVLRLSFYRRIANARTISLQYDLKDEMVDRFGPLPERVENLFGIMKLRALATGLNLSAIEQTGSSVHFRFDPPPTFQAERIFELKDKIKEKIKYHQDGFDILLKADILSIIYKVLENLHQVDR